MEDRNGASRAMFGVVYQKREASRQRLNRRRPFAIYVSRSQEGCSGTLTVGDNEYALSEAVLTTAQVDGSKY